MRDVAIVSFVSESTAEDVNIGLGFRPDHVVVWSNVTIGQTPDRYEWFDTDKFDEVPDADGLNDDAIKITGSTGATSVVDALILPYAGNEVIAAANDENYRDRSGAQVDDGTVTSEGITIAAAAQVNSGVNVVIAYRNDI